MNSPEERNDERKEILTKIDDIIEKLKAIKTQAINYEYTDNLYSATACVELDMEELKEMIYEAKENNKKE